MSKSAVTVKVILSHLKAKTILAEYVRKLKWGTKTVFQFD